MNLTAKDVGMLFLGSGVLIFSLVFLHMYVTRIMPQTNFENGLTVFCNDVDNETFALQLNMYHGKAKDIIVYVGNTICKVKELNAGSSYICTAKSTKSALIYNVSAKINNKEIIKSGICKRFIQYPIPQKEIDTNKTKD